MSIFYKRTLFDKIIEASQHFPALILTGARQTGKTTLLRMAFPKHTYISLDLPSDAALAENDPEAFLKRYPAPLLIDEIQYAPKLFRHLKYIIDKDRQNGHFILTGSQKFTLMKEVSDSLAGRAVWIELETLSMQEINPSFENSFSPLNILATGGFPQLWKDPHMSKREFFSSYLATYIERE